jgi:hypothetical protein
MYMSNIIVTGCDDNTAWQLPWFLRNLFKYNPNAWVLVADFGLSPQWINWLSDKGIQTFKIIDSQGWFKKPEAMIKATAYADKDADKVCWLDTDCEVRGDISSIFNHTIPNKLSIVKDRPWTNRRPELGDWYNTGVVVFEGCPDILIEWKKMCEYGGEGDQTTLHEMFNGNDILKMKHIEPLAHTYNTLRLDILDGIADTNPLIMHWTGPKGNQEILRQINESS